MYNNISNDYNYKYKYYKYKIKYFNQLGSAIDKPNNFSKKELEQLKKEKLKLELENKKLKIKLENKKLKNELENETEK